MKKLLLLFLAYLFTNQLIIAQILVSEDFEDATVGYTLRDESNNAILTEDISQAFADEDYFGRITLANLDPADNLGFSGFEGTHFFGANDYDGIDQSPFQITTDIVSLNWNDIDITGFSNIKVSGLFAEGDADDGGEDWDRVGNFPQVRVEYSFDNSTWTPIFSISAVGTGFDDTNAPPALDFDNDNVGEGMIINEIFVELDGSFASLGNDTVSIRVYMQNLTGTDEDIAIDNFIVENACSINPPDQVTSLVSPIDGATNVTINTAGDPDTVGPFEWGVPASGDPADSFTLNLGITTSVNEIGSISNFTNSNFVGFNGWQPNTTYFWRIDAVNCSGVTLGPVWSFTTGTTCTESLPNPVINPIPADDATNVTLTGALNELNFSWDNGSGDPGTSFTLNIGTTGPDDFVFPNFLNGNGLNALANDTTYFWRVDATNCAGTTTGTVWSFTTGTTCTESLPNPVINPTPADGATNVTLTGALNELNFSWDNGSGDPGTSFTLNIGTTGPDDFVFPNFLNGNGLNALANDTTYFWRVDATNCVGTIIGNVWTFTTGATLSSDENDIEPFKIYPNPTSDILNIKTTLELDHIEVYNLAGQNVATFNKENIIHNSINLTELSKGLYLVRISVGDQTKTIKITKE